MTMIGFNASYLAQPAFGKRKGKGGKGVPRGGKTGETMDQEAERKEAKAAEQRENARIQRAATNESLIGKRDARKGGTITLEELKRRATAPKFEGWA